MSDAVEGEIMPETPVENVGIQPTQRQIEHALEILENGDANRKITVIEQTTAKILAKYRIIQFRGKTFILEDDPYPHYRLLGAEEFKRIAYPEAGGVPRSRIGDIYELTKSVCDDLTPNGNLILFGMNIADATMHPELTDTDAFFASNYRQAVWDMTDLAWSYSTDPDGVIWRSPYPRVKSKTAENESEPEHQPIKFIMDLAGGDTGLYDDIMQSIAPLVMDKKPDGVVWWVGNGANGKSTLMDALYRIFPNQLASLNVRRLVDGRDTPTLNGKLANVAKESSEGRIEDTEIYKCLGTHENFDTHKFHSQESITINGNVHSIFSGNSIPVFADKGHSIRRRTFIIPFNQVFESDPDFEKKTFTAEFFGQLVEEITRYAQRLRRQGYRYKWSAATTGAKQDYDREASNAEQYARQLVENGVVAFTSYSPLKNDYENWCADEGYPPLGLNNLRKAMGIVGFERVATRGDNSHIYRLRTVTGSEELQAFGQGRIGLFTLSGFTQPETETVPHFTEDEKPQQSSILKGKW